MSGFILFDTSRIKSGAETNYIMATYGIYLSIFNIFISLLQILGIMGGRAAAAGGRGRPGDPADHVGTLTSRQVVPGQCRQCPTRHGEAPSAW
jgi:hypothetical protein